MNERERNVFSRLTSPSIEETYYHGIPNKVHQTCKFWTEKKCRNSSNVCRFIHSYHCPDGVHCRRTFCTMDHTREDGKEPVMANKKVIRSSASKIRKENGSKRRQRTDLPKGKDLTVFDGSSISSDWNCSSVAFEDFDEELCQGLEEVGQELARFEEEVSESNQYTDEVMCLKEVNYPSEYSSQDDTSSHKHPLKSESVFEVSHEIDRSTRNMVDTVKSTRARKFVQEKQTDIFDEPGRALQSETSLKLKNIPVINSNCQRKKNVQFKQQDLKKKNVHLINVESTAAVDSNNLNEDKIKFTEISNNPPIQDDCQPPCSSSHINKNGVDLKNITNNKTKDLEKFCASSDDTKDTEDCRFSMNSLFNFVAKIREESYEAHKEQKYDRMPSESDARYICQSNTPVSLHTLDSSHVSSHCTQLEDASGNSALDIPENTEREEGEICDDDEKKELMALLSQKEHLMHKVKVLLMQKKNLSLQRDSIMNNFDGDTDKLTKILNGNSQLLKEISTCILKLNAQIKLISKNIDVLENNRSFAEATEMTDQKSKEQVNVSGCSISSPPKKVALKILELFESISNNNKKPLFERLRNECHEKLKGNIARTNCKNDESLNEQSASLSNNHSLHDDKIKVCAVKRVHESEQAGMPEVQNSENHIPEQNVLDEDLATTDITTQKENGSIEKGANSENHNSEENKLMTNEKNSSLLEQYNNVDACNRSLVQTQCLNSFKDNDIPTEQQTQNNVETPGEGLCKESEKVPLNKGKLLNSSKDMSTHWCKPCNVFFTHVYGYVKHLESSKHMEKTRDDDAKKWVPKLQRTDAEKQPKGSGGNQETVGVEFLHSTKAFFCELCESVIWNTEQAVIHPQTPIHIKKYKEHVFKNTNQEVDFLQAKMAAFTKYCEERIARSKGTALKELCETGDTVENLHRTSEDCTSEAKCKNDSDSDVICLSDGESKSKKYTNPREKKRKLDCNEKGKKKFKLASQEVSKSRKMSKKRCIKDIWKTALPSVIKNTHGKKKKTSRLSPAEVWTKALPSLHLRQQPHSL